MAYKVSTYSNVMPLKSWNLFFCICLTHYNMDVQRLNRSRALQLDLHISRHYSRSLCLPISSRSDEHLSLGASPLAPAKSCRPISERLHICESVPAARPHNSQFTLLRLGNLKQNAKPWSADVQRLEVGLCHQHKGFTFVQSSQLPISCTLQTTVLTLG